MQRAAQRDDRARRAMGAGGAKRLRRALVCAAAVPAVLITAACSSDSGDSKAKSGAESSPSAGGGSSTQPSASASPTVRAAAYQKLPDACAVLSKGTLSDLVPKGAGSGKKGSSDDPSARASCAWNSLDNNGVKGSQFRWLNVSLLRFDSDATRGSADDQAHAYYGQQVKDAQSVDGAKNSKVVPLSGTGAEASAVRYDLKKKEGLFKQQTVVARVENVVVTLDYNGAGLAGEKTPDADDLTKAAEKALKEAVAAVSSANGAGGQATSPSSKPSKPSKSASGSPSSSPSKSASAGASPSGSAAKES
ncbi:DUF3558 domain-containing protein [Streptomyces sp. Go40/10]|uniref:DUF3558 domain-containing protein n=1 Tax=Streptomyces sp. Go40/10 TaxID=2825844 RepID=UPI001E3B8272|nr:DUF3558 domain-containing protein [Streptomyces sp. Go40/10]UFR03038.1 DUF3558 domain-containing protein [Streptomyces sp. Go40/10]